MKPFLPSTRTILSRRLLPVVAAATGLLSRPTVAAEIIWNATTGLFGTDANWTGLLKPGAADFASVNNGGTAQIVAGDTFSVLQSWAGNATAGNISQSGGTYNVTDWFVVGRGIAL